MPWKRLIADTGYDDRLVPDHYVRRLHLSNGHGGDRGEVRAFNNAASKYLRPISS